MLPWPMPERCWIITGLISSNPRSDSSWHVADTSLCFESYAGRPGPRRFSTTLTTLLAVERPLTTEIYSIQSSTDLDLQDAWTSQIKHLDHGIL